MAIEKMTFISMDGAPGHLDEVLQRCIKSGMFQPEYASRLSEYSIGSTALLRNPYGGLLVKFGEIASQLRIEIGAPDGFDYSKLQNRGEFIEEAHATLDRLRKEYPAYFEKRDRINNEIISYTTATEMLRHIDEPDINFDELWENKFLKIRFGRMPTPNIQKLEMYEDKPYELYKLDSNAVFTWCLYITAGEYRDEIDEMFHTLRFERLRIPDYIHGTTVSAMKFLEDGLHSEREKLEAAVAEINGFIDREKETLTGLYGETKFLHDAYDLRKYAVSIHEHFHLVGFVQKKNEKEFLDIFSDLTDVEVTASPVGNDPRLPAPVKLKNNWFVRPFEMFVNMYGSPSYNDIDPSPFVAYTYSILFGMMFGDAGHGFCVFLLGMLLWRLKKMQLGQIMSRIGVVSMFFGVLYGSVFGFEHLLDGFYQNVFGLHEKPIEVMHPDTTNKILIAAILLGAATILMVIIFNILIGLKHRDFDRMVLSHNGVAGLIFYSAVLMIAGERILKTDYVSKPAEVMLIVVPLVLVFFREPIMHLIGYNSTSDILKDQTLAETATFKEGSIDICELFDSQFVTARFGRIPTDNYRKLTFYQHEPFMLYPVKSSHDYIWCIYAAASVNKNEIDAIFRDLLFERLYIPEEHLESNECAEEYIKRCVDAGGTPEDDAKDEEVLDHHGAVEIHKDKGLFEVIFPDGVGGFFTQTFFEMFEVILSFVTNTMSFLRVGGFILIHAGMMAVVFTLAGMVGGGASPVVIIIGNIFVMALEGLIVGIQVLRLEFYEIFSRFFNANGEPFKPVTVQYNQSKL